MRLFAPEVIQTSHMDCGVAALKCLFDGLGRPVSYDRLRDACQTDVDGTSIDTLEEVARKLGVSVSQVIVPPEHVADFGARLPAILVVRQPGGLAHFVVVWRQLGGRIQIMDPSRGRAWWRAGDVKTHVYSHPTRVTRAAWLRYATGAAFLGPLGRRLAALGLGARAQAGLLARSGDDEDARLAQLDAAVRMVAQLRVAARLGAEDCRRMIERLMAEPWHIPPTYWFARVGPEHVELVGAVVLRVESLEVSELPDDARARLGPDLQRAIDEPDRRPWVFIASLVHREGAAIVLLVLFGVFAAAVGTVATDVLLRSLTAIGESLRSPAQRAGALLAIAVALAGLGLVDYGSSLLTQRVGRRWEYRVRLAFLDKLPRIADRFFRSRLVTDTAERVHMLQHVATLPQMVTAAASPLLSLAVTAAGLCVLAPDAWPLLVVIVASIALTRIGFRHVLSEREMRSRALGASVTQRLLDALRGLVAIRAHRAELTVRRTYEAALAHMIRADRAYTAGLTTAEGLLACLSAASTIALIATWGPALAPGGQFLLFAMWAMSLPTLASELTNAARNWPMMRNLVLRATEMLDAPEEDTAAPRALPRPGGMSVRFDGVRLQAGGHTLIDDVSFELRPGEHVAVVGRSGAGKSSLAAALLGIHRPTAGAVWIDFAHLTPRRVGEVRREIAWVDPSVTLWSSSLLDNLRYGNDRFDPTSLEDADLLGLVERLPYGLQSTLGDGGGSISGGEGQRVRFGRALGRVDARLVILDEAFRGLDREARRRLLAVTRRRFADATMLVVSHDVEDTAVFGRVLVVEQGRLVEDGPPSALLETPGSLYRSLVEADRAMGGGLSAARVAWRRISVEQGRARG